MKRVLTGITTTGTPHLGNYVGAIRPSVVASQQPHQQSFFFLANDHALIKCHDPERVHQSTLTLAATWLACGLDPQRVFFYRQSDIPEVMELNWILSCVCAKGLMNRAHAYKAAVQENEEHGMSEDPDHGIEMGLYNYPILMAADILIFNANIVPVGNDQVQHLEMTRDIAGRFNHRFRDIFVMPEAYVDQDVAVLAGLDGRKMSKSYNNTIPLFVDEKQLRKLVMKIQTNSQAPEEPKDPDDSLLFDFYKAFAGHAEQEALRRRYAEGIGWGEVKELLFATINAELAPKRQHYQELLAEPQKIEEILQEGAAKARVLARELLNEVRDAVGIRPLA